MIAYVEDYLRGDTERLFFDLDFHYYLRMYYPAMERRNPYLADCFVYYLCEEGVDLAENLSDDEHKCLIRRQFEKFSDALRDGL
jgi:hypothetical protein